MPPGCRGEWKADLPSASSQPGRENISDPIAAMLKPLDDETSLPLIEWLRGNGSANHGSFDTGFRNRGDQLRYGAICLQAAMADTLPCRRCAGCGGSNNVSANASVSLFRALGMRRETSRPRETRRSNERPQAAKNGDGRLAKVTAKLRTDPDFRGNCASHFVRRRLKSSVRSDACGHVPDRMASTEGPRLVPWARKEGLPERNSCIGTFKLKP